MGSLPWRALFPDHQYGEGVRRNRVTRMRLLRRRGRRRPELSGDQVNIVRFRIESQCPCTFLSGNVLCNAEFVLGIFLDYREVAIAAGSKRESGIGIKSRGIHAL